MHRLLGTGALLAAASGVSGCEPNRSAEPVPRVTDAAVPTMDASMAPPMDPAVDDVLKFASMDELFGLSGRELPDTLAGFRLGERLSGGGFRRFVGPDFEGYARTIAEPDGLIRHVVVRRSRVLGARAPLLVQGARLRAGARTRRDRAHRRALPHRALCRRPARARAPRPARARVVARGREVLRLVQGRGTARARRHAHRQGDRLRAQPARRARAFPRGRPAAAAQQWQRAGAAPRGHRPVG